VSQGASPMTSAMYESKYRKRIGAVHRQREFRSTIR
jgi:hypothetical protein